MADRRSERDTLALIKLYSNYDCTNSFDTMDDAPNYLSEVYQAVKTGVRKSDFVHEHSEGAYGGALFCFAARMPRDELLELANRFLVADSQVELAIPKGTQFGFYSSFQGSASMFESRTWRGMRIPKIYGSTDFDELALCIDAKQRPYPLQDVFGCVHFADMHKGIRIIK